MAIKALVVDNNPVLLRAVSAILEKEGCEVQTAVNGLDALDVLKKNSPDIVFTDLVMPLVGGEQLCKIIRSSEDLKHVFLVVISGILLEDFENILADKYYDLCIAKGNLQELKHHIQDALVRFETQSLSQENLHIGRTITKIPYGLKPSAVASELLSEKRHLNRILDNLDEGIVELNKDGVIVSLNGSAQRILGVNDEDVIGSSFNDFEWGEHKPAIADWLQQDITEGENASLDIQENLPLRFGGRIVTMSCIPVQDGSVVFRLCILRDITRQFSAEEKERELDSALKLITKMDAMSCMAGGIVHDFNNLLTVICGNLDMISHTHANSKIDDWLKLLEYARTASYMAVDLTRKISNFSPFGIVSRKKQILENIVEDAVSNFVVKTSSNCVLELSDEQSIVSVDDEQISAALGNILQNSYEANINGSIHVSTQKVAFTSPSLIAGQYVPVGEYACVTIKDNGCGIDRELLLRIFDPYFSTKSRGSIKGVGLGLTVVYATMRNHGGYVVVQSELQRGTSVSCYLPHFGYVNRDGDFGEGEKETILNVVVIDKDPQVTEVVRIMLEYLGHKTTIVSTVKEALERVRKDSPISAGKVQVVLIDPTSESTIKHEEICELFHSVDKELKIVITGGSVLDPVMQDFKRYKYANALPKPFTMDSLKHVLNSVTH